MTPSYVADTAPTRNRYAECESLDTCRLSRRQPDFGCLRNLPIDVARELCADVVIAVWLTTPQPSASEVASAVALVGRSLDVVIRANEREQIDTLSAADVGIGVFMGDVSTADFQKAPEAGVARHKNAIRLSDLISCARYDGL